MQWHSVAMAEPQLIKLRQDLKREFRHEIADGRAAGYTLFAQQKRAGECILFIPPGAVVLFDRMPSWKRRLRRYAGAPDLKGSVALPLR